MFLAERVYDEPHIKIAYDTFLSCFLPVLASGRRRQMPGQPAPVVTRRLGSQFLSKNLSVMFVLQ